MCIYKIVKRGMQLRPRVGKPASLSSAVKNASWSQGWLRLVVQCIFATLTVACFSVIIFMTISSPPPPQGSPGQEWPPRCHLQRCRVSCNEVPYYGLYEDDIAHALMQLDEGCKAIQIILNSPMFINNTMPPYFLSNVRYKIQELHILSGNLMHFPPEVFMNQYVGDVQKLEFYDIQINDLSRHSFAGLSRIKELTLRNCRIVNVSSNVFRHVSDSLQRLTITASGTWDPVNFTSSPLLSKLCIVDFSYNHFHDFLNENSFNAIINVKTLRLNSCRITALGTGTFDKLHKLEYLYLDSNNLVEVPTGLFTNLIATKPKINLNYNKWHCDCSSHELRILSNKGMLLNEPYCETPDKFKDITFSELQSYCADKGPTLVDSSLLPNQTSPISDFVFVSHGCYFENMTAEDQALFIYSPVERHACYTSQNISRASMLSHKSQIYLRPKRDWLHFSYLIRTETYTLVEVGAAQTNHYGLVWYQSACPNEVYCVNAVPTLFRMYNIADLDTNFILCPMVISSGALDHENCVSFENATESRLPNTVSAKYEIILNLSTAIVCLTFGAAIVYALIRKYPYLLKGSKRILLVKHKTVEALVLPPKVPLRKDIMEDASWKDDKIFVVPTNVAPRFNRSKSTRSSKSAAPSYISAMHPTEDQLADWRIRNHFSNDLSILSIASELTTSSFDGNDDYISFVFDGNNEFPYESLK